MHTFTFLSSGNDKIKIVQHDSQTEKTKFREFFFVKEKRHILEPPARRRTLAEYNDTS